jgi:hypothetical protein
MIIVLAPRGTVCMFAVPLWWEGLFKNFGAVTVTLFPLIMYSLVR